MKISNITTDKIINILDYIPLQLRAKNECKATEYFTIRKGDRSLLEIAFDSEDATIHRITLLICEEYQKILEPYYVPNDCKKGDISVNTPGEIDSPTFRCEVYPNAIRILVSDADSCECVFAENVVWELTEKGDLVSICILDPTGKASNHCYRELEANHQ